MELGRSAVKGGWVGKEEKEEVEIVVVLLVGWWGLGAVMERRLALEVLG